MLSIYNELRHKNTFTLYALKSVENNREVYTFNVSYSDFINMFKQVPYDADSDLLLQRETQKSRINAIYDYIKVDYAALPACGAILESFIVSETPVANVVKITIPPASFRYLFDGQGRRAAIEKLLTTNPEFNNHNITIKGYETKGVNKDNQLFSDWNGSSVKPNKSICQSMDSRALINTFTKQILKSESMYIFNKRIDYTKASVTMSQNPKLWSLNQFNTVVQTILGVTPKSAEKLLADEDKQQFWTSFIVKYFNEMLNVPAIESAISTEEGVKAAKENTVIGTSVWLKGMAVTGRAIAMHLMQNTEPGTKVDWSFISALDSVDFSKNNLEWVGRCMDFRGRFQDKGFNHKAMAAYLLPLLGIPLSEELELVEDEVLVVKSEQRKAEREAKQSTLTSVEAA
mgnify:CR=1 FL=1